MSKYTHALRVVGVLEALSEASDGAVTAPQSADGRGVPLRPVLLSNRAACYMQLQDYPMALADCRDCLRGEGRAYAKGWVRLAQCLAAMGKDRRSLGAAQRVSEPRPPLPPNWTLFSRLTLEPLAPGPARVSQQRAAALPRRPGAGAAALGAACGATSHLQRGGWEPTRYSEDLSHRPWRE